ncbi:putative ribonuclease H-like domain-containing protein [Tanacetum coccineum]
MTGNKEKLDDFVMIVGGTVTFGGGDGRITGKGTIRTSKLNFKNVYYVEELQNFNLFSVSQICDTKNKVLFTDKECLVLSKEFQLPENNQVVLRVPRRNNLYCFNLSDIKPERGVTCLLAKASLVESTKWHRRMTHVNFKNMNKLAKHGLVNGLPSKLFTNEHNCVACNKGKQHKASYKAITVVSTIFAPLQLLHMDLFGPTSIRSIDHKYYSLVVTDDFSRFTWVFFLGTKDETYGILKDFITFIENQLTKKVKAIRCDNGTEFKNSKLIELCGSKGIRKDYSNARTPQQNGVAERKNRTLIEAAGTMLADSMLPTMFWTEAELVTGTVPNTIHLKPFGCLVTILNTSDHLGKFDGKADEGFIVGYAAHSKAYRVYNLSSKKIEETLNLRYLEDKPNVQGLGHEWYFDLDYLTDSLGYTRFKTNQPAGTQDTNIHADTQDDSDSECDEQVIVVPFFPSHSFSGPKVNEASEMMESTLCTHSTHSLDSLYQPVATYSCKHTPVGFLEKPKGSADYHEVLDFLRSSHIRYAISHDPLIYDSLVKQFWSTASLETFEEGPPAIIATIDSTSYTITESLVQSQLQLDDEGGVEDLPIADIYLGMDNMGYPFEGKLTFHKNKFSPQ